MKINKIIFLILLIIFLIVGFGLIKRIIKEREAHSLINPEIYPTFRRIENYCLLLTEQTIVNKQEYERCKTLVNWMEKDSKMTNKYPDYSVSAEEYYKFSKGLGFNLPPIRFKIPPTDVQKKQAMTEQERLMEQQRRIIEAQINKNLKDVDAIIKSLEKEGGDKSQRK